MHRACTFKLKKNDNAKAIPIESLILDPCKPFPAIFLKLFIYLVHYFKSIIHT